MVIVTENDGIVTDVPSTTNIYNVFNESYNMKNGIPSEYIQDIIDLFNEILSLLQCLGNIDCQK